MKGIRIRFAGVLFMIMTLLCSCQEFFTILNSSDEVYSNSIPYTHLYKLELSTYELTFNSSSVLYQVIDVKSGYAGWKFTDIPEWISISPSSGDGDAQITVSVTDNTGTSGRVGIVKFCSTVENWNFSTSLTVSQERTLCYANPETTYVELNGSASSTVISVESNTDDWSVSSPSSISEWCTVIKTDAGISITVTTNMGNTSREGQLKISTPDSEIYMTVVQHPAGISSITEQLSFGIIGGMQMVPFTADAQWTAQTSNYWIDVNPGSGNSGTCEVSVTATANKTMSSRKGYIYISLSSSNKMEIPVYQEGIALSVDNDQYYILRGGRTIQLSIKSNTSWTFTGDIPDWINCDVTSGTGDRTVTISVSPNMDIGERSVTLYLTPTENDYKIPVVIRQDGYVFDADSTAIYFSDLPGSTFFNVTSDFSWFAVTTAPWITLNPRSGNRNETVTVSVTENTADSTRVGHIIVGLLGYIGVYDTISVYQTGKYLNVSSDLLNFTSKGGQTTVSLKANNSWTAQSSDSWISLSATEGTNDCNLEITAGDNASVEPRIGYVLITPNGFNPVYINVNQSARDLKVSVDTIEFFGKGGVSNPVTVNTEGIIQVTTDEDWLTINEEFENQFTVTAAEYYDEENDRIGKINIELTDLTIGSLSKALIVVQKHLKAYNYVDLGLSVLWATANVGAEQPEEFGDYFAWGEIEPYYEAGYAQENPQAHWLDSKSAGYDWSSYRWCNGSRTKLTKYCGNNSWGNDGYVDSKTVLDLEDDVAHVKWGGEWRMPTYDECRELQNNCIWIWTTQNGVNGYKVTSSKPGYTDCSIFLPAAGRRINKSLDYYSYDGLGYWSSSLSTRVAEPGYSFGLQGPEFMYYCDRYFGYSVRPVRPSKKYYVVTSIDLNQSEVCMTIGGDPVQLIATPKNSCDDVLMADIQWTTSDDDVATVSETGCITAVGIGTVIITASMGDVKVMCSVKVVPDYVDLGLSVKWATINVGAGKPEGYGDYFAWGETETYYKIGSAQFDEPQWRSGKQEGYWWPSYTFCDGSGSTLNKYNVDSDFGKVDNKVVLDLEDDVAHIWWGDDWRMPTIDEFNELIENCSWSWITINGVNGYKVTSEKPGYEGQSVFLPASGNRNYTNLIGLGELGCYRTSSLFLDSPDNVYSVSFQSDNVIWESVVWRAQGQSVRPVCP